MDSDGKFHLHLISDATGETIHGVARACLAQFEEVQVTEHLWPMVRSDTALDLVIEHLEQHPGLVIYTMVNQELRDKLRRRCGRLGVRCVSVLEPVMRGLRAYLGTAGTSLPGRQHVMDDEYFHRIDAMQFAMAHDDGQATWDIGQADIILLGVSRTSKTPTSIYLANRGVKAANVPIVPGVPLPLELFEQNNAFIIGLTNSPERLVQLRRNRLLLLNEENETDYVDLDTVKEEVQEARKMFTRHGWPVIDVTRRSIEETAAAILQLYTTFLENREAAQAALAAGKP